MVIKSIIKVKYITFKITAAKAVNIRNSLKKLKAILNNLITLIEI